MKKAIYITTLFFSIITACEKQKELLPSVLTDNCELPNGHLKWTSGGTQTCANASLFGDQGSAMTINGIALTGETFTMELDNVMPGTYAMTTDSNHILHTDQLGMAWESTNGNPATLVILSNNTSTNVLEANFSGTLKNPLGLNKTINSGTVKITYTE
ncbi:MAG: hypothetical protein KA347_11825 [Bacteroidia bacterium]|jgi:hypothetical protein|nr:hypothetical protein [Bacteroidia bacterium]MBP7245755.1 hypothetical protein [Bacteroidia bacterium]